MIIECDRQMAIDLIAEAVRAGARQCKACEVLAITCRTLRRWKLQLRQRQSLKDQRKDAACNRIPANSLTPDERQRIVDISNQPKYRNLSPSQIVPKLADQNIYIASESSFYRVLKSVNQLTHRGNTNPPKVIAKPKSFKANASNQVWSWDITFLRSAVSGNFYRLYLIEDIFSRKIVGWEVHENESATHASILIQKACLKEGIKRKQLVLHSDNGSPMKGATMLATLQRLGIVPSFSRPSVSDDNPYSESLFRTLKYVPTFPSKPFQSIECARQWVYDFVQWYNNEHQHSAIQFVTPNQRHLGLDKAILQQRKKLYKKAKLQNPSRWAKNTRNWEYITHVWLNPSKQQLSQSPILDEVS